MTCTIANSEYRLNCDIHFTTIYYLKAEHDCEELESSSHLLIPISFVGIQLG